MDIKVFGAEMFIAWFIAKAVQTWVIPDGWMLILLPLAWLTVHFTIGGFMEKYLTKDIF